MLEVGQTFPSFSLLDDKNNTVTKESLLGKPYVVYVYPKDNTSGCTIEALSFKDYYQDILDLGVQIFGISSDSVESHVKFKEKHSLPFPLLSDPDHSLLEAMGSYGEKMSFGKKKIGIIRSTFVIGLEGKVTAVWPKVKTKDHGKLIFEYLKEKAVR